MDAIGAERLDAQRGSHGRVDPPGDTDHDVGEPVLLDVVAQTEGQGQAHLLERGLERDDRPGELVRLVDSRFELDDLDRWDLIARAIELASPRVAQATRNRVGRLDVDDEELLGEPGRAGDDLTGVVDHDRVPVEDELVLAADEVAEGEERAGVASPRDEHLLAVLGLPHVERRRGQVDDELRAREGEVGGRRARLPDVLADRDADRSLTHAQKHEVAALGEVAVLVEDAVVREEVLAVDRSDAST